jgi:type II secretory pathway pseudopilin PulG
MTNVTSAELKSKRAARLRNGGGSGSEDGYILIAVLFMVAMVLILLSIAAPKVAADIERDREVELMHRGKQYIRAIKLYYKKFGAYPPNMEALEKSNDIRFLRKRYKDPMTGKDEWHLIHFGENKTPTAMGFFGQPMAGVGGSTLAGTGPGGVGQSAGGSIFGNSAGGGIGNGVNGSGSGSIGGLSGGTSGTDPNAANGATGTNGANGPGGTPGDPNAPGGNTNPGGSIFPSSNGGNSQTFGGGGIIGVESTSPKTSILEYKKKKHFNEWEFVYDPMADQMMLSNNTGAVGQPMSGAGNNGPGNSGPGASTPGIFGNQPSSPGSFPGSSSGTPTPPQQPPPANPPQQ